MDGAVLLRTFGPTWHVIASNAWLTKAIPHCADLVRIHVKETPIDGFLQSLLTQAVAHIIACTDVGFDTFKCKWSYSLIHTAKELQVDV